MSLTRIAATPTPRTPFGAALPLLVLTAALGLAACAPAIGDSCTTSQECPEFATCDSTATNGYCIIFECPDFGCPEESVCIEFRTFSACMKYCESNGDCRKDDGMVCRTDNSPVGYCYHPESEP